jgi:isoquinoline 1-oxidoreductase beta subunit
MSLAKASHLFQPSRREFIFGISALAAGLVLHDDCLAAEPLKPGDPTSSDSEITAWVVISPDDDIVIRVARSDMGQGILTALPMLIAEELECNWDRVRTESVSASENVLKDHRWGPMVATNSISIRSSQAPLRKAGAQARVMLVAEAAARWGVPPEECRARDSVITHEKTGRSLRFGEVAAGASKRPVPENVPLKPPSSWRLIGTSARRLEAPAKVLGEPIYATDVRVPGMLYAAVRACPAYGGKLKSFQADKVLAMSGVRYVVPVGGTAVAVVATSWWQAHKGLEALSVVWDETASTDLSTDSLRQTFREGLSATKVDIGQKNGDVEAALAGAAKTIEAEYEAPYLAHVTMEPQTCTAHVTADHAEVWAPTQNAEGTLTALARVLNFNPSQITIHACQLGGGFGRRGLAQDWAIQAVLIAKAVGQPVKMIWSREEDIAHDYYRPMILARQRAGFDAAGNLIAWQVRISGSSIFKTLAPQFMRDGVDFMMMDGFLKEGLDYSTPANFEVGYAMLQTAIPVGFWRAVNLSQNTFFREVFVDEMAAAQAKDPYQFRRTMLAQNPRAVTVLDEAARLANWGKAPPGIYQGIALIQENRSVCAEVIELSISADNVISVHRIVCVVDPNFIAHPDITIAQMEGAIIQGLGTALTGEITFEHGRAQQSNFNDYTITRMNETPKIEVYLLPSLGKYSQEWGGVGETGLPTVAPALVNAIYAATGTRIRSLPIKKHGLSTA